MGKNKNWFIESTVEAGEVVINDGGSSVDFRIEGDTDANLLVTDGSADRVGIGTNTPTSKFEVTSDTIGELLTVSNHNVSSSMPAEMILQKSRGSKLAPGSMGDGDEIGQISWKGYDGSNYDELAYIKVDSTSVSSDTSKMTLHSDKFVLDTGTLQFGSAGQSVSEISLTLDANSTDNQLCTAKAAFTALAGGAITFNNTTGSVAYTNADQVGNVGKVFYLSSHSTDGTFSPSILEADNARVHVGGDVDTNYVFKVTGATGLVGATTITGATQVTGALTVGVNDTGHDVKLFGATAGKYMLWDESADSLILGVDDTGVDFIAYGATANKKLHWDESADSLLIHGGAELGQADGDILKVHGIFKLYDNDAIFKLYANSSSQANDIFQVYDKNDALALSVENSGVVEMKNRLKFTTGYTDSINVDDMSFGCSSGTTILNFDNSGDGGSFAILKNVTTSFSIDNSRNISLMGVDDSWKSTTKLKLKTPKFVINDVADSASTGVVEVSKVTTSTGNLTLDSNGGTVTVDDHLTVTGNISVTGSNNFSSTTSTSFNIDSGGKNLGFKAIAMGAASTSPLNDTTKWIAPVDATGNVNTAGLLTRYIASDDSIYISTKDAADNIYLTPNHDADGGTVYLGQSVSKGASLHVYNNATVAGDLTVTGSINGTIQVGGTTGTSFQLDSDATGGMLVNVADHGDIIAFTEDDGSTLQHIHTTGITLDANTGASSILNLQSYGQEITLKPGTNATGERYVEITGTISALGEGSGATTYNRITGAGTKMGKASHSDFASASGLGTGDVAIYGNNHTFASKASEGTVYLKNGNFVFGADSYLGTGASASSKGAYFYGTSSSSSMAWAQSNNKLVITNNDGVGNLALVVTKGDVTLGAASNDNTNFKVYGNQSAALIDSDAGNKTVTFGGGVLKTPTVKDANYTLLATDSGSPIAIKNKSSDSTYTLPAVANGLNYKFMIVERTGAYDVNIVTPSQTNFFFGSVIHIDTDNSQAVVSSDNDSNNKLNMQLLDPGSIIEVSCDGTNWFISGYAVSTETPVFSDV
jgi:hypothetical protein